VKTGEAKQSKRMPTNESVGGKKAQIKQKIKSRQKAETKFPPFFSINSMIDNNL
jgi:hypothetical protein